ncbi:MAG: 6-bladed beta-propeller [Niabella sp.]
MRCIIFLFLFWTLAMPLFSQDLPKIRINPYNVYGGTVSEYFSKVDYIPLETNQESLFGDAHELVITDSTIVASDWDTKSVLFFTLDGKFIRKVKNNSGKAFRIMYDPVSNKMLLTPFVVFVDTEEKTSYYTIDGLPTSAPAFKLQALADDPFKLRRVISLGDNFFAVTNSCIYLMGSKPPNKEYALVEIYEGNRLHRSFLNFNPSKTPGICAFSGGVSVENTAVKDGRFYVSAPGSHIVYEVSRDAAIPKFQIVFPADLTIPDSIMNATDAKKIESLRMNFGAFSGETIIGVNDLFLLDNYFCFRVQRRVISMGTSSSDQANLYNFIYDTLTGRTASLERIIPDEMSYFLPFANPRRMVSRGYNYDNKGNVYNVLSSLQMFTAREDTKLKKTKYPPMLQEYFKTQNKKSNPVIVKMKIKSGER